MSNGKEIDYAQVVERIVPLHSWKPLQTIVLGYLGLIPRPPFEKIVSEVRRKTGFELPDLTPAAVQLWANHLPSLPDTQIAVPGLTAANEQYIAGMILTGSPYYQENKKNVYLIGVCDAIAQAKTILEQNGQGKVHGQKTVMNRAAKQLGISNQEMTNVNAVMWAEMQLLILNAGSSYKIVGEQRVPNLRGGGGKISLLDLVSNKVFSAMRTIGNRKLGNDRPEEVVPRLGRERGDQSRLKEVARLWRSVSSAQQMREALSLDNLDVSLSGVWLAELMIEALPAFKTFFEHVGFSPLDNFFLKNIANGVRVQQLLDEKVFNMATGAIKTEKNLLIYGRPNNIGR